MCSSDLDSDGEGESPSADVTEALQKASDPDPVTRGAGYEKLAESWPTLRQQLLTPAI